MLADPSIIIPKAVAMDHTLSYKARIAWGLIAAEGPNCAVSIPTVASWLGCTDSPASTTLRELVQAGLLSCTSQPGLKNRYSARYPK